MAGYEIDGATVMERTIDVTVRNAGIDDKPILRQLLELYEYDFSEYTNADIGPLGYYGYRYLDHYWTDADRHPYLIDVNGHIAGFALVNRHPVDGEAPAWSMAEFFILRKYRSKGIGETAAVEIFNQWPGRWQVTQLGEHPGATAFWRKVIDRYTNGKYEEREARWGSETGVVQFFESWVRSP